MFRSIPGRCAKRLEKKARTNEDLDCDEFFFKNVRRSGGYRGYGAANAQFRIAAQKRGLPGAGTPKVGSDRD